MTSSMVLRGSACEGDVESGVEVAEDDDEARRGIADACAPGGESVRVKLWSSVLLGVGSGEDG